MFDIDELVKRLTRADALLRAMPSSAAEGTFGYHLFSKAEGVRLALSYIDDMKRSESRTDSHEPSSLGD